jgi:Bacteriophage lambda integrase, Arm DNA-binding domain/GIY-YIG catalytic domain
MARPRKEGRKLLPDNLYVLKRRGGDYYSYRNPVTGRSISIGYDKASAVQIAEQSNREVAGDSLEGESGGGALLSHDEIVVQSYPLGGYSGVYFLISKSQIMYVGKSADVEFRLGQHRARRKIEFDSVFIIACPASEMARLEARYIRTLKPPFNSEVSMGILLAAPAGL